MEQGNSIMFLSRAFLQFWKTKGVIHKGYPPSQSRGVYIYFGEFRWDRHGRTHIDIVLLDGKFVDTAYKYVLKRTYFMVS